jgi:hypothetical protein
MWSGLGGAAAVAQTDLSRFPLTKAIPADVFIAVAARENPEQKFLKEYWAEVGEAFFESGVLDDLWELITDQVPDEELDKIENMKEQFSTLCGEVEWGALFGKEMIYAGRFSSGPLTGSPYEGLLIGRLESKKQAAANCTALKAILKEVVELVEAQAGEKVVALGETEVEGQKFTTFGPAFMPQMISLGGQDDLIILSLFNRSMLQESMALLKGASKKQGLVETPRFKQAFKELPPAEELLVFWDAGRMFEAVKGMIREAAAGSPPAKKRTHRPAKKEGKGRGQEEAEEDDPETDQAESQGVGEEEIPIRMISKLLSDLAVFDYTAKVEWTDGYRVFSEQVSQLVPDAKQKALYGVLAGGTPIEKFEKYIPKEATSFSCHSGINFPKLYRYITGFVEEYVPEGKRHLADFEKTIEEGLELNLEKDVLALLDGGMISVAMDKDWVFMLKVTDEKKATQLITKLLDMVNEKLKKENALMITEVEVAGRQGFMQLSHPMMLMFGGFKPPVLGFADGYLILGSSVETVARCLRTAQGEHPNITKNERWQKEALPPKTGPLDSIGFSDETNTGTELQAAIGGLCMATGMIGMFGQDMPPEVRSFITSLTPILTKLGPVAAKIDFYQSSASYCTFSGTAWHERQVQNYKPPKPTTQPAERGAHPKEKKVEKKKDSRKKNAEQQGDSERQKKEPRKHKLRDRLKEL